MVYKKRHKHYERYYTFHYGGDDILVTVTTPRNYAHLAVVIALQYAPVYPSKVVKSSLEQKLQ